jgi:tetratricopeptide (TPR) repeat protein
MITSLLQTGHWGEGRKINVNFLTHHALSRALCLAVAFSCGAQTPSELAARAVAARDAKDPEAAGLYRAALRADPKWRGGWLGLGHIEFAQSRWTEARDAFIEAARLDEQDAAAWAMLGLCEYELKEFRRAVSNLQRALGLNLEKQPDLLRTVQIHLGILFNRGRQPEFAQQMLGYARGTTDEPPLLILGLGIAGLEWPLVPAELTQEQREVVIQSGRAQLKFVRLDMKGAAKEFAELAERYPETPGVNYSVAVFLLNSDRDAALRHFEREIAVQPNHYKARIQIVWMLNKDGKSEAALPYAEAAVKLAPEFFPARMALGQVLLALERVEEAVKNLEEAVRLEPGSPDARFQLGRAYKEAGREDDARREYAEFQKLDAERRASK